MELPRELSIRSDNTFQVLVAYAAETWFMDYVPVAYAEPYDPTNLVHVTLLNTRTWTS